MDPEAARTARESLDLAFHMSNILDTGLDRHTLSILIALCDLGVNPEALAAVVKELQQEPSPSPPMSTTPSSVPWIGLPYYLIMIVKLWCINSLFDSIRDSICVYSWICVFYSPIAIFLICYSGIYFLLASVIEAWFTLWNCLDIKLNV